MIDSGRPRKSDPALAGLLVLLALAALPGPLAAQQTASRPAPPPQEKEPDPPMRTPFASVPANDPRREIIQTVLGSAGLTTGLMTEAGWKAAGFHMPWQRVGQYFPKAVYFTTSRIHFLTHYFHPSGVYEIEIFDSPNLRMGVKNRGTFAREAVVGAYQGLLADDPEGAAAFARKLGALEPCFRDEDSKEKLRRMLDTDLFDRLLKELREEGYHIFAGALVHEGTHAMMDDPGKVAAIQEQYKACKLAVQWDELRAYMAEISYHGRFTNWAVNDIFAGWKRIEYLHKQLERLRKKPKPLSQADKDALEAVKAKIKAYIALIRLRMREIEESGRRMQGLMAGFLKDHLKPTAAAADRRAIDALFVAMSNFTKAAGEHLKRRELLLKGLESYLDLWNRWASCELKTPPDRKTVEDFIKAWGAKKWPAPPLQQAEDLRKKGNSEVAKFSIASGGAPGGPSGPRPGRGEGGVSLFMPGDPPVRLEFSGLTVQAGLSVRF